MENKRLLLKILLLLLCSSCGTTLLVPPHENFLNLTGSRELNESDLLANKYHRANRLLSEGFKNDACADFEELSKIKAFPLKEISFIKALESCDWTAEKYIETWKTYEISPWLKQQYLEASLRVSKNKNIKFWESRHNYELSFYPKIKNEREAYLRKALEIAENEQIAELIEEYNTRLLEISPRFIVAPKNEELFSIGRDYERASEYKKAIETYESILRNTEISIDVKIDSWHRITRAFKNMRRKDLAHSSTYSLVKWIEKNKSLFQDNYNHSLIEARTRWARSAWTQGELRLATKIINNSIKLNISTQEQNAFSYYLLASIAKEEKKLKSALYLLEKSREIATGELKEKVLWQIAWLQYKNKNYSTSSQNFIELHKENSDISQYTYWAAKSLSREKKSKESLEYFEKTIEIAPLGFYGLMAKKKIGITIQFENKLIEPSSDSLYTWLIRLGEYENSKKYLDQFVVSARGNDKLDLLAKMTESGHYSGALRTFFNMGSSQRDEVELNYTSYIYPKPVINSKYLNKNIDINLVYSIIRQESAFNKDARSFADAFGLMQIIPQRAKRLAAIHRLPYKKQDDLYSVELNTGLGSHYLSDLVRFFNELPFAIGSYNAGESVMKNWIKSRYDGDIEVFIEDVPYRETKKYIKLVLRNLEIYKALPIQESKFID
ncbi:lytic transglycosylase domain-containing protein [Halobacteriovorax sp. HLS]|uniref:lytic transglycosylase domain-containing protein n=1 Tax=Halobacteriovorax sp. HLS TaxID=2234000 RepID=UPI000FD9227E|nr:lytic transglycosylase domain-containing protein [Halobacteriovorax sp. HLS]